ncbi:MAG: T9SS type A sorting domain-containing protein [Bacteroidetes bacterium]|nr:T9SS type A sorting domain-containing protein [Bacteroidota bacterium]
MKKAIILFCFVLKVIYSDAQLQLNWVRTERDTSAAPGYNFLEDLVLDENSNLYVNGTIDSFQTIIPIYISYDSSGMERWRRTISELGLNFSWRSLKSPLGHVVFAGEYEDQTGTNNMIYTEYNYSGDSIGGGILNSPGFTTGDDLGDICIDRTGNLFLAGQIRVGGDFPAAVARFDAGSEFRWLSSFPILPGWSTGDIRAIEMCGDTGMYCLTVNFTGFASVLYCDTAGTFHWEVTLPVSTDNYHSALATDNDFNAIVGGRYNNNNFGLVKLNFYGDTLWTRSYTYPGLSTASVEVVNIKTDSLNNIYVLGTSNGINQYSLITKFDSGGSILWMDTARGVGGMFGRNKDFMQLKNGKVIFTTSSVDGHIYGYNESGQRIIDQPLILPGLTDPEVNAIEFNNSSVYLAGNSNIGFNVRLGFVARLDDISTGIKESVGMGSVTIFPNPARDVLNFKFTNLGFDPENYFIYDLNGKLLQEGSVKGNGQIKIDILEQGNYFIQFSDKKWSYSSQFKIF